MTTKRYFMTAAIALTTIMMSAPAYAGKVDDVKKAVKDKCGTDIAAAQVLESVIKAYDCNEGTDVKIGDCSIKCLKANSGNVVGGK